MIKKALQAFMAGLIDYAGFFPPANLDLQTSLTNYGEYLANEYGWMMSRCIIPCKALANIQEDYNFRYSIIVSPEVSEYEVELLSNFSPKIAMIEVNIADTGDQSAIYFKQLNHIASQLEQANICNTQLFIESPQTTSVAEAIAQFNNGEKGSIAVSTAGYKLRCGGLTGSAYPHSARVAEVISTCSSLNIPWKFTGGLHQPLRNYHQQLDTMQHGFINIFGASLLHAAKQLPSDLIVEMLDDENGSNMHFTDDHFSWKSHNIATEEIKKLRENLIVSFGSCSFEEPLEGLAARGFI